MLLTLLMLLTLVVLSMCSHLKSLLFWLLIYGSLAARRKCRTKQLPGKHFLYSVWSLTLQSKIGLVLRTNCFLRVLTFKHFRTSLLEVYRQSIHKYLPNLTLQTLLDFFPKVCWWNRSMNPYSLWNCGGVYRLLEKLHFPDLLKLAVSEVA